MQQDSSLAAYPAIAGHCRTHASLRRSVCTVPEFHDSGSAGKSTRYRFYLMDPLGQNTPPGGIDAYGV